MNVKIVDIAYLNRIGKFMSMTMAEGLAKEKVINFHRLNCISFYKSRNLEFKKAKYNIKDLNFIEVPLISSVQAVSDLETIYVNCLDSAEDLDLQTFEEIKIRIEQFKEHFDYDIMKQYKNYVVY